MENQNTVDNADNVLENNENVVKVNVNLLKDLRNLIEVVNYRIHWKTNELISVGVLIKQLDDLLVTN